MDDDKGYPYFRKAPYQRHVIVISNDKEKSNHKPPTRVIHNQNNQQAYPMVNEKKIKNNRHGMQRENNKKTNPRSNSLGAILHFWKLFFIGGVGRVAWF